MYNNNAYKADNTKVSCGIMWQHQSDSKSRRFFSSVETCVLTVADFFWTITPVFLQTTLPRMAFVPLSGLIPRKRLKSEKC